MESIFDFFIKKSLMKNIRYKVLYSYSFLTYFIDWNYQIAEVIKRPHEMSVSRTIFNNQLRYYFQKNTF